MGKINKKNNLMPVRRNYKLYKAKKQWLTACVTFLLTFGTTAVVNASVHADEVANSESISENNATIRYNSGSNVTVSGSATAHRENHTVSIDNGSSAVPPTPSQEESAGSLNKNQTANPSSDNLDGKRIQNDSQSINQQPILAKKEGTLSETAATNYNSATFTINVVDVDDNNKLVLSQVVNNFGNGAYTYLQLPSQYQSNLDLYPSVGSSGVPEGVTFAGSYWASFNSPGCNWSIPNCKWTANDTVWSALNGATLTILIGHKTSEVTEYQTRNIQVNYINAITGKPMTGLQPASLNLYYQRTKITDLVTNEVTYSSWQFEGQIGFNVISGDWNLSATNNISVNVPTVSGYTAFTQGDWTINSDGTPSSLPANEFVAPNTENAYSADAILYAAQPVHTIYYAPTEQTQARTVTANFKIVDGNQDGPNYAPASQVQVFYDRSVTGFKTNGSSDPSQWTITYGEWSWDQNAGDNNTPGFHVISGKWFLTTSGNASWSVILPAATEGYTIASLNSDHTYSTNVFAAPNYNPNTVFTNDTDSVWFVRNQLTTYYVDNSLLNQTITRTINVYQPIQPEHTIQQNAELSRSVSVNTTDSGVAYSNWNSGTWDSFSIPTVDGYTPVISQTVNGVTTPITSIDQVTVNDGTQPITINIRYTATATAELTGNGNSIFNNTALTMNDLNNKLSVKVTGPNTGTYTLQPGDVEFSVDNGNTWSTEMPINAGTYQIRLTKQGIANIQKQFGNDSIVWEENGQSTIMSDASWVIKEAQVTAILSGQNSMTYTGNSVTTADLYTNGSTITVMINGSNIQNLPVSYTLQTGDYEWQTPNNQAPSSVGKYTLILTEQGIKNIQQEINQAMGANNVQLTTTVADAGSATFDITQANADITLSGTQTSPQLVINPDAFKLTSGNQKINIPILTASDYQLVNSEGQPIIPSKSGTYIVTLTAAGLKKIADANPNYTLNLISDAKFNLEAVLTIRFEDLDNNNQVVGIPTVIDGMSGSTVILKLIIPENYELAPGQTLPTEYTFNSNLIQKIEIKLVHATSMLNPLDPSTNPDLSNPDWFKDHDLIMDVTRTITYEGLSANQLAQIPAAQKSQAVEFTRTARYDKVTGEIIPGSEGSWIANGSDKFAGFTPKSFVGYTANPSQVPSVTVTADTQDSILEINYMKNPVEPVIPDQPERPVIPERPTDISNIGSQTNESHYNGTSKLTGEINSPGVEQTVEQKKETLPQTGDKNSEFGVDGGLLVAMTGLFGLLGTKKKKHE